MGELVDPARLEYAARVASRTADGARIKVAFVDVESSRLNGFRDRLFRRLKLGDDGAVVIATPVAVAMRSASLTPDQESYILKADGRALKSRRYTSAVAEMTYDVGLVIHNLRPNAVPRGLGDDKNLSTFSGRYPGEATGGIEPGAVVRTPAQKAAATKDDGGGGPSWGLIVGALVPLGVARRGPAELAPGPPHAAEHDAAPAPVPRRPRRLRRGRGGDRARGRLGRRPRRRSRATRATRARCGRRAIPAADFTLRDQDGKTVSMRSLRGGPVVVGFMYSTCKDTCPLQAQQIRGALRRRGRRPARASRSAWTRPTTRRSARAASWRSSTLTGRIRFLLGSRAQLEPIWRAFGIQPQGKGFEHTASVRAPRPHRPPVRRLPHLASSRPRASRTTSTRCAPGTASAVDTLLAE